MKRSFIKKKEVDLEEAIQAEEVEGLGEVKAVRSNWIKAKLIL